MTLRSLTASRIIVIDLLIFAIALTQLDHNLHQVSPANVYKN
ncbi:hypothetical protein [Nostoc sp. MS1]|nr:hypothetical protein [Nostoc sp. MS1]